MELGGEAGLGGDLRVDRARLELKDKKIFWVF